MSTLSKFVFEGFKESFAWRAYFSALDESVRGETFTDKFCQSSWIGYKLRQAESLQEGELDWEDIQVEGETYRKVYIDTFKLIGFSSGVVSSDLRTWKAQESPDQGVLYLKDWEGSVEVVSEYGVTLDLAKSRACLEQSFSVQGKFPLDILRRNLASPYLLNKELSRHGVDYELDYGNKFISEYTVAGLLEVKTSGTVVSYSSNGIPLRLADAIEVDDGVLSILGVSDDEIVASRELQPGIYNVLRRKFSVSPKAITTPSKAVIIALVDRIPKADIEKLLIREKPLRAEAQVVYYDLVLIGTIESTGSVEIKAYDFYLAWATYKTHAVIEESTKVNVGFKKNEGVTVELLCNRCSWRIDTENSQWVEVRPRRGDSPRSSIESIEIILKKDNRSYEEIPVTIYAVGTDVEGQVYRVPLNLIVDAFVDNIEKVEVREQVFSHDSVKGNPLLIAKEAISSADEVNAQSGVAHVLQDVHGILALAGESIDVHTANPPTILNTVRGKIGLTGGEVSLDKYQPINLIVNQDSVPAEGGLVEIILEADQNWKVSINDN